MGILFALAVPTLFTWLYFVLAADLAAGAQQQIYLAVKVVQFAFPLVWVLTILREPLWQYRPRLRGDAIGIGTLFSAAVVAAGWLLYSLVLRDSQLFADTSQSISDKLATFGIVTPRKYAALGLFYSLCHSLLEEYYWRWFVFGHLRLLTRFWPAAIASALFFACHHVIVLAVYFGATSPITWLFSARSRSAACSGPGYTSEVIRSSAPG